MKNKVNTKLKEDLVYGQRQAFQLFFAKVGENKLFTGDWEGEISNINIDVPNQKVFFTGQDGLDIAAMFQKWVSKK